MANMDTVITMLIEDAVIEIAKKAIKEGSSLEFINKITNLDIDVIKELQAQQEQEQHQDNQFQLLKS